VVNSLYIHKNQFCSPINLSETIQLVVNKYNEQIKGAKSNTEGVQISHILGVVSGVMLYLDRCI